MDKVLIYFSMGIAAAINLTTDATSFDVQNVEENDLNQTLIDHGSSDDEHNCEHDGLVNTVGEDFEKLFAPQETRSYFAKCFSCFNPKQILFFERVVGFVQARISFLTTAGADHDSAFDDLKQLAEYMKANDIFLQDPEGGRYDDVYHDDARTATFQISGTCWAHASARALRDWFQQQFQNKISMLNLFPFENNIQKTLVHLALGYAEVAGDPAQRSGGDPTLFASKVGPTVGALMMIFAVDDRMRDIGQGWLSDEGLLKLLCLSEIRERNYIRPFIDSHSIPFILTEDVTEGRGHSTVLHQKREDLVFTGFDSNNPNLDWIAAVGLQSRRIHPSSQMFTVNLDSTINLDGSKIRLRQLSAYSPIDSKLDSRSFLLSVLSLYKHQPAKVHHYFEIYGEPEARDARVLGIVKDCSVQEIQQYHDLGWNFNVPGVLITAIFAFFRCESSSSSMATIELLLSFGCDPLENYQIPNTTLSGDALWACANQCISNYRKGMVSVTANTQKILTCLSRGPPVHVPPRSCRIMFCAHSLHSRSSFCVCRTNLISV